MDLWIVKTFLLWNSWQLHFMYLFIFLPLSPAQHPHRGLEAEWIHIIKTYFAMGTFSFREADFTGEFAFSFKVSSEKLKTSKSFKAPFLMLAFGENKPLEGQIVRTLFPLRDSTDIVQRNFVFHYVVKGGSLLDPVLIQVCPFFKCGHFINIECLSLKRVRCWGQV